MSNNTQHVNSGHTTTIGLLGVSFIVLKLTGYIQWSWLWVLAPFWGGIALAVALLFLAVVYGFLSATFKGL